LRLATSGLVGPVVGATVRNQTGVSPPYVAAVPEELIERPGVVPGFLTPRECLEQLLVADRS